MITIDLGEAEGEHDEANAVDADLPGEALRVPRADWESGEPLDLQAGPVRIRIAA